MNDATAHWNVARTMEALKFHYFCRERMFPTTCKVVQTPWKRAKTVGAAILDPAKGLTTVWSTYNMPYLKKRENIGIWQSTCSARTTMRSRRSARPAMQNWSDTEAKAGEHWARRATPTTSARAAQWRRFTSTPTTTSALTATTAFARLVHLFRVTYWSRWCGLMSCWIKRTAQRTSTTWWRRIRLLLERRRILTALEFMKKMAAFQDLPRLIRWTSDSVPKRTPTAFIAARSTRSVSNAACTMGPTSQIPRRLMVKSEMKQH